MPRSSSRPSPTTARRRPAGPSLVELAEDWLAAKGAMASAAQVQKGHSDRARRGDLARWGRLLSAGKGIQGDDAVAKLDVVADLVLLSVHDLTTERITAAVAEAKQHWSEPTVQRMLSTLRGFTRWLARQGHLDGDPCEDEMLRATSRDQSRPRALAPEDVEAMATAAEEAASGRQKMFWPTRDVAIVRFLAGTGARAEELCGVTVGDIDRRAERPIWRVNVAKGGKRRDVPLGRRVVGAVDAWLDERPAGSPAGVALRVRKADPLFVRVDGRPLTPSGLDRLLRVLALRAAVTTPEGAMAHAFRHSYGVTLALRGVPQAVIGQLMGHADPRTTSIYTTVASGALIAVLDDAGLL
ncbi:MAG: tyrosine-type recombinase/integrase [Actinomycetota bacterium]|nr:tyrosine-type recombinase/integrase [Actinomycetota bacterium]